MAIDVAGVGLGFAAGGDLLAGVLHQVGAAVFFEGGLVGEEDVLGGQFVADVVVSEVAAPRQQAAGGDEDEGDDGAGGDDTESMVRRRIGPITARSRGVGLDVGVDVGGVHGMFVDGADVVGGCKQSGGWHQMIPSVCARTSVRAHRSP